MKHTERGLISNLSQAILKSRELRSENIEVDMAKYEIRDPDFEARVRAGFAAQGAMNLIGIRLVSVKPGAIEMVLDITDKVSQQQGFVHGGVITAGLDSASGFAAQTLSAPSYEVLTIEFKTSFFAPSTGDYLTFRSQVLKSGRRVSYCEAEAFTDDGTLVAKMSTSIAMVEMPEGWSPKSS